MNSTHHSLLVQTVLVREFVLSADLTADAEVLDEYNNRFGIQDARDLVKRAYNRPSEESTQCLVVRSDFITHEAQNALLKIIEEPPLSTRFIFILPEGFSILPTLMSRFQIVKIPEFSLGKESNIEFYTFLSQCYKDRLTAIEKATKQKDVDWQQSIKRGLIQYIKNIKPSSQSYLFELEFVARKLLTRGASNKMLLEHMSLILPENKS